jgi:hypothetical protein
MMCTQNGAQVLLVVAVKVNRSGSVTDGGDDVRDTEVGGAAAAGSVLVRSANTHPSNDALTANARISPPLDSDNTGDATPAGA